MKLLCLVTILLFLGFQSGCAPTDLAVKACDKRLQDFAGAFTSWAYDRSQYFSRVGSAQAGSSEHYDFLADEHVLNQRGEFLEKEARSLAERCPYENRLSLAKRLASSSSQDFALNRVLNALSTE
jgi:hypothetical protein